MKADFKKPSQCPCEIGSELMAEGRLLEHGGTTTYNDQTVKVIGETTVLCSGLIRQSVGASTCHAVLEIRHSRRSDPAIKA